MAAVHVQRQQKKQELTVMVRFGPLISCEITLVYLLRLGTGRLWTLRLGTFDQLGIDRPFCKFCDFFRFRLHIHGSVIVLYVLNVRF